MANTLRDLITARFGVQTELRLDPVTNTVGVTPVVVLTNNPDRLSVLVVNLSAVGVYLKPAPNVSASSGVKLNANGGTFSLLWEEDFHLTGYEWWAIAEAAGASILVVEVQAR